MKSALIAAAAAAILVTPPALRAQSPAPSAPPAVNRAPRLPPQLPPPGITISDADRAELTKGVAELRREIDALAKSVHGKPEAWFLPDVEIFHKAVDWPLRHNEFYNAKEIATAKKLLAIGKERAAQLAKGQHPWTDQTGLVVRGYLSFLDDSVQPYGLVIPANWKPDPKKPSKALVWLLGRGNNRTELAFLNERMAKPPEITCPDGITIIPYGRFCNATKFAGESDVFEVLENLHIPLDPLRAAVAGFSMGGASAWHLGAHHAALWCFVAPGAGFAETREYAKVFAPGKTPPPWWEQVLWRWYDATEYAANLGNVPTLAYSGELDKQIQAAQIMIRHAEKEGVKIEHFIGPKTEHKYEPETRKQLVQRLEQIWNTGAPSNLDEFRWVTHSLIYPGPQIPGFRAHTFRSRNRGKILGMDQHWERAELSWKTTGGRDEIKTANVRSLSWTPHSKSENPATIILDGQELRVPWQHPNRADEGSVRFTPEPPSARMPMPIVLQKRDGKWAVRPSGQLRQSLEKVPTLCGPIDHAFMSRFVHVRPTGAAKNEKVGAWAKSELEHARKYWRQIFRGDALVMDDTAITDAEMKRSHLVLWGDPSSNAVLKRIVSKLPLEWTKDKLIFGGKNYDATKTAPVLIFPNPENPSKYVVLNSGVTMRESAMGTNSQQTPKLPDWAIVDLDTPPGPDWPGKILDAGFFDEQWRYTTNQPKPPKVDGQ